MILLRQAVFTHVYLYSRFGTLNLIAVIRENDGKANNGLAPKVHASLQRTASGS